MLTTLYAAALHTSLHTWHNPVITLTDDGLIDSIESADSSSDDTILTSTFFDVHFHGAVNHDVMDASPAAFDEISRFLATRGVSHYLPTTVTAPVEKTLCALEALAAEIERADHPGAIALGIHLEGPFVSHAKRGVHPPEYILPPSIELFDRFQEAARGQIRLITIAPETEEAVDLIRHATAGGVRVSLGHTNATAAEARAGIAAGAVSATHTFNAMRALDHREPGVLGTVLDDESLFAEVIADGIHVAPEMLRLFLKAKGLEKSILVTDGMAATGMPSGTYMLGGFPVEVAEGRCMADGVLAGSVLTMDLAVANFRRFTGLDLAATVMLASRNPAQMLGLEDDLTIDLGKPANFNRYAADGRARSALFRGKPIES